MSGNDQSYPMPLASSPPLIEPTAIGKERVFIGAIPDWVVASLYDPKADAEPGSPISVLLDSQQIHAERRQIHFHKVCRLETMLAVERTSQVRIPFDPQTETVTVHWIKIRRADQQRDHADLERFRILQREEGLEWLTVSGHVTLLLLLDDVRPADILDVCYTIDRKPKMMADRLHAIFDLPVGFSVRKFHYAVHFRESRSAKWKSLTGDWNPVESRSNGEVVWLWAGEKHNVIKPEPNTPTWHIGHPLVQVSDCADWKEVSAAFYRAWEPQSGNTGIAELAEQIRKEEATPLGRLNRAIRLVQDEFRYLSVNWELGGHVPTSPEVVAHRRYGDCKDLSFLLVHLLRALGVKARPVLVNTVLSKTVREMLPSPWVFNHAIVEFDLEDKRRWVDLTSKRQGGSALNRVVPNFGIGLAIEAEAGDLIEPPHASVHAGVYEMTETLLLDTTGASSVLSIGVTATGCNAEWFRQQFENISVEEIAKERLHACANRYGNASRLGDLEYRDEREANQFVLAELFEVNGFLRPSDQPGLCTFPLPPNLALTVLPVPDKGERRNPFELPYPCHVIHTLQVENSALQFSSFKGGHVQSPFVTLSRTHKHIYRHWSTTFEFSTEVEAVPADQIVSYRDALELIWREAQFGLFVPVGYARPRQRDDFGKLPSAPSRTKWDEQADSHVVSREKPATPISNLASSISSEPQSGESLAPARATVRLAAPISEYGARHKHRPRRRTRWINRIPISFWFVAPIALFCALLIYAAIRSSFD